MPFDTNEDIIVAEAHCDGPCGVYDPASARVAAEAVQSMTKKMVALAANHGSDCGTASYINTMSRYAAIKEEEAHKCKSELLVLWTDFFKPQHLGSGTRLAQYVLASSKTMLRLQSRSKRSSRTGTYGCSREYSQCFLAG